MSLYEPDRPPTLTIRLHYHNNKNDNSLVKKKNYFL